MTTYTVLYNRSSVHINGLATRSTGRGTDMGDHISYYAQNACGALSRGASTMQASKTSENVTEILKAARGTSAAVGNKLCKKCEAAAEAMIAARAD